MSNETIQQLTNRVSELEKRLQATEELLARFVRFDEESESVVLAPNELLTPLVSIVEALADDGEEEENSRIQLSVDDEDGLAFIRIWDQEENLDVQISSAEGGQADFYHAGVARASIVAGSDLSSIEVFAADGETTAVRMSRTESDDSSRLDVYRGSGTLAAAVATEGELSFVSLFDVGGDFATVRMINDGEDNNLAVIEGWRSEGQRAFQMCETTDGEGGQLNLWAGSTGYSFRSYAYRDAAGFVATNSRGESAISASSNDRSRAIVVLDFLQKGATGCGVDVGGNIGLIGSICKSGLDIHLD